MTILFPKEGYCVIMSMRLVTRKQRGSWRTDGRSRRHPSSRSRWMPSRTNGERGSRMNEDWIQNIARRDIAEAEGADYCCSWDGFEV